ncbi:helix-turn-helix domain-containing protein [Staphylococcus saprophyticus]|uniref:helix-turn-helix domain-containing protein n=1 Tax=Staphylococcus saprophyticus TaxID=29385 RepID=UPI00280AA105|nr:helix-turn-helix transcriptional regulator [Staphylococcus saprophyticus]WMM16115.1 helix-turn-helix transcriptional regulator [Staphylococcus saprophyticus]
MTEFGSKLKELRGKKSIRQTAKGIGISHTYLDSLEKGIDPRTGKERKPTIDVINKISLYFNYDFNKLVDLANIFVSLKNLPEEQKEIQHKKFMSIINKANNENESKVKENFIKLLERDLTVDQVLFLRNAYKFIETETKMNKSNDDNNNNNKEKNRNNIIFIGVLLQMLNQHKNSGKIEVYEDIINDFDVFLKDYLNIK